MANAEMAKAWDGHDGDHWTDHADRYDRAGRFHTSGSSRPSPSVQARTSSTSGAGPGTDPEVARRVGDGSVLGVDLSSRMLELARKRSADAGLGNVEYVQADAQVHPFEPESFDLAVSSFGMMFFDDPIAAFANVGGALRPGGRLGAHGVARPRQQRLAHGDPRRARHGTWAADAPARRPAAVLARRARPRAHPPRGGRVRGGGPRPAGRASGHGHRRR